jgi:hypothetical protein
MFAASNKQRAQIFAAANKQWAQMFAAASRLNRRIGSRCQIGRENVRCSWRDCKRKCYLQWAEFDRKFPSFSSFERLIYPRPRERISFFWQPLNSYRAMGALQNHLLGRFYGMVSQTMSVETPPLRWSPRSQELIKMYL